MELLNENDLVLLVSSSLVLGHDGGINLAIYHVSTVLGQDDQ